MRSNRELAEAVVRRAAEIRLENTRRRGSGYAVLAVAAGLVLVVGLALAVSSVPVSAPPGAETQGAYIGTLLAGGVAGGYVLVGVAAFAVGIGATFLSTKLMGKK